MNYATMIFSPTGGTEKVTAALTAPWGGAARSVDLTDAATDFSGVVFQPEDMVVIAVPYSRQSPIQKSRLRFDSSDWGYLHPVRPMCGTVPRRGH